MAGIISNVDSDVQKLRKLKNEIENVKKALMGINIKVDIDIAKGLQSQLTSLLGQYDTLVDKIAAAERKIMLSTSRINKATEKIVQAQEQVSKPAGIPTQSGNTSTQTNTAETASIQAQAKAYDDLRIEINGILGTREENVKRMIDEMNAIRLINVEIKKINKSQGDYSSLSSAQQKRLEQLNNSLLTHKEALAEIRQTLNNNVKLDNVASTSMKGLSQSLSRMRIAYRELTEEERNSPFGKELLTSINQADAKIKELDATIGNHQRNVGNYGKQWNGLSMSIQQVGRELPSLAYGPKVFFSAISNNLPILVDEIKRARIEYDLLKKSGQSATPVWKQVASSSFSWQTALMVGITLLTLYGDKVVDWVAGLFNAKNVMKPLVDIQQQLNDVQLKGVQNAQSEITKLELLYKATQNASKPIRERKKAVDELQKSYPDFFKNLSEEEILTGKAADAYARLTSSIIASARARAAQDKMTENAKKILENEAKITEEYAKRENAQLKLDKQIELRNKIDREANPDMYAGQQMMVGAALGKVEEIDEGIAKLRRDIYELNKSQNELAQNIDVNDLIFNPNEDSSKIGEKERKRRQEEAENRLKQQEQLAEQLLSLRRKNQQDEINLRADGTEKKLAQIDLDYQKELDAIKKQRKDWETAQGGKLTDKQEAELGTWASNAAKKRESDIDSTSKAKLEADKKVWQEYFIEFGNYQEKRKNFIQKYDDEIAKLQTDSPEYAIKVAEKNQAVEQLDEQYGRTTRAMADLFEDASNKSVSAIQDIINKYEALIEYMSGTDKDISIADLKGIGFTDKDIEKIEKGEISIKDVTDAIRGLKDELKGKSPWQTFVSDLEKGIEAIKKGGSDSKKVGQGITDIGNAVTSFAPALGEFGSNIANIFGVSDSAITGATDALGGLGTTAAGVGQIMSGDIVGGAMSAVSGISSVVSAFEGLFGADYSDYENMKAQYETLISIWDELITKKMDYIDIDYGTEAIKAAEEAEQLVNIQISRQRQLIKQLASSGASAGSHSLGYRINDRLSKEDYQRISGLVGQKITAEYQLWDLSSEQIEKILSDEKLVSVLDTVNKDFVTYLQNIVDYGEQLTEIAQKEKEAITGIGFDEFKNGYADLLSDLDSTNEDFANNFEKDLRKAIFQSLIANKYKDKIKELYDAWANYGKDGLSSDEAREIRDMQAQLTDSLLAEREQLMKDFGWFPSTEQQSASSKGFQAMSQDTGEELNGRFTALQIAGEEIKNQNIIQSQSLNLLTVKADALLSINTETRNIADDTRDLIAQSYLELVQISENTGAIVKPIIQIQKDMAEVKNNTSKL